MLNPPVAYAFMVAGVYVPYFFIQSYALDLSIDERMTFNVVSIMNAATFFGRFPYNYLADMYAQLNQDWAHANMLSIATVESQYLFLAALLQ